MRTTGTPKGRPARRTETHAATRSLDPPTLDRATPPSTGATPTPTPYPRTGPPSIRYAVTRAFLADTAATAATTTLTLTPS